VNISSYCFGFTLLIAFHQPFILVRPSATLYRVIKNDCLDDQTLLAWPRRSPDATPRDFFLWGYVKDQVYVPPLPASIPELRVRIRTAI
jgi:hypothetical protein